MARKHFKVKSKSQLKAIRRNYAIRSKQKKEAQKKAIRKNYVISSKKKKVKSNKKSNSSNNAEVKRRLDYLQKKYEGDFDYIKKVYPDLYQEELNEWYSSEEYKQAVREDVPNDFYD